MSADHFTSMSNFNFASIFNAALVSYKRKAKKDLASHPLLPRLQSCDSPEAILTVLRKQIPTSFLPIPEWRRQNGKVGLPTVNVLYAFSATVGQSVRLVRIGIFGHGQFPL
jgi:hypothetical protein